MASKARCEAGYMVKNIDPEDLAKIYHLREASVVWPVIAASLRKAGWVHISAGSLGRHFRGGCRCADVEEPAIGFSFTSVTHP